MGGGGEPAPEVENAIETHGLGWTDTEEKAGFDIQWDGNTEGLERVESYVKISDLDIPNDQIVGLKYDAAYSDTHEFLRTTEITQEMFEEFIEFEQINDDYAWLDYWFSVHKDGVVVDDIEFAHKGIYVADPEEVEAYISRVYKEATTEEVVHQIDQKYIPGGEFTVVIDYDSIGSDTQAAYDEALAAFQAKKNVLLKKGNVYIPMTGYDSEHCFFGGTESAYLPGNIINAVYAHVGPNGNKFWWRYTIPLGADALGIADEDEHFTGTNVESALAELASRLDMGGAMVVTLTVDEETAEITADKTVLELGDAFSNGIPVIAKLYEENQLLISARCVQCDDPYEGCAMYFGGSVYSSESGSTLFPIIGIRKLDDDEETRIDVWKCPMLN